MMYNSGKRTVMKQLLNALWGKLAQNENACVLSFIEDFVDLLHLVNNSSVQVTTLDLINENLVLTTHHKTSQSTTILRDRNVVIASFITAYARLELYNLMKQLSRSDRMRLLYCNTDSVVIICDANFDFKRDDFLGDLTDELIVKENRMFAKVDRRFCSSRPKTYSYKTN